MNFLILTVGKEVGPKSHSYGTNLLLSYSSAHSSPAMNWGCWWTCSFPGRKQDQYQQKIIGVIIIFNICFQIRELLKNNMLYWLKYSNFFALKKGTFLWIDIFHIFSTFISLSTSMPFYLCYLSLRSMWMVLVGRLLCPHSRHQKELSASM